MKNSSVAAMVRRQFNINDDVAINVVHLYTITVDDTTNYEFKVQWYDGHTEYTIEMVLPHLEPTTVVY